MICKTCGEDMSGDGFTIPFHCINRSEEDWWYSEPDSGPWYCDEDSEDGQPSGYEEAQDYMNGDDNPLTFIEGL